MNKQNILRGFVGAVAVLVTLVIAGLALTCCTIQQSQGQRGESPTSSPIAVTMTPSPFSEVANSATVTPAETQPPLCTFSEGDVPTVTDSMLDTYAFSDPTVVLTSESAIEIVEWLLDGQRLLITRRVPNQARHYIEIFDVQTGKTQRYGEGSAIGTLNGANKPTWLDSEQAVAYADFSPDNRTVLRISHGDDELVEEVVADLASPYLATDLDGSQVIYFSAANRGQPQGYELSHMQSKILLPGLQLPVANVPVVDSLTNYQIAVPPQGSQIAYYSNQGFYLANSSTGQICEIDWGGQGYHKRWVVDAYWSPDGRYLAASIVIGDRPFSFTDLDIIDTITGERYSIDLGMRYLYTLAWAPNSRDALVIAKDISEVLHRLYLVDIITGNYRPVLQDYPFRNSGNWGVVWSNQGHIALGCPVFTSNRSLEGRLCIIAVETR